MAMWQRGPAAARGVLSLCNAPVHRLSTLEHNRKGLGHNPRLHYFCDLYHKINDSPCIGDQNPYNGNHSKRQSNTHLYSTVF